MAKEKKNRNELLSDLDNINEEREKLIIKFTIKCCYKYKEVFTSLSPEELEKLEEIIFNSFEELKNKTY